MQSERMPDAAEIARGLTKAQADLLRGRIDNVLD